MFNWLVFRDIVSAVDICVTNFFVPFKVGLKNRNYDDEDEEEEKKV
jgi:hypothetical protein